MCNSVEMHFCRITMKEMKAELTLYQLKKRKERNFVALNF